jgi:hypothetical protein
MCSSCEHDSHGTGRNAAGNETLSGVNWALTASRFAREVVGWWMTTR